MSISVFDLFSVGVGPSSSHTVGPMRAAYRFIESLKDEGPLEHISRIQVDLYGSLALTGKGHGTDFAVLLGLCGWLPDTIPPEEIPQMFQVIKTQEKLTLGGQHAISFIEARDMKFHLREVLPHHANGLRLSAFDATGALRLTREYYSVGGGFVLDQDEIQQDRVRSQDDVILPYPFETADQLLLHCRQSGRSIAQVMMENEQVWRTEAEIREGLLRIWQVMSDCIDRGCLHTGILPGGLHVKRRAPVLFDKLKQSKGFDEMNWLNLFSLAVNEENAGGGRVVTAPTNGAAGIIPAVLRLHIQFQGGTEASIVEFLLTAGAMGILFKLGASISAAEVGCQGEVGVACSMAGAALCAVMGGSVNQVENAAEIGMEHHLGLTCDPIGGLVQIPCIERNAMGSIQAVNAAKLALMGDGEHIVSLDSVIKAMRDTGYDMMAQYKETALGGLAKHIKLSVSKPAC